MLRNLLLEQLLQYQACDEQDVKTCEQIMEFVEANPDCFLRSNLKGHITGSAWIIDQEKRSSTLLGQHRKINKWIQLGGHADGESNILQVALREAQEESGLLNFTLLSEEIFDVDVHQIQQVKDVLPHLHFDIRFIFEAKLSEHLSPANELLDLRWVDLSEVINLNNSESLARMVRKTSKFRFN